MQPQNHYQVLRIERTADERAIKKAYFTLVREFPPDKHPDEFKKIREAYEVLSDPVARQRFDNADKDYAEYDEDVAARLRDIDKLGKEGTDEQVREAFEQLVADHPDVVIAREGLAMAWMRANDFAKARAQWEALCEKEPDEPRFHLFRGISLHRLEKPKKAEAAIRKAKKLAPDVLRYRFALIDLMMALDRPDDAVAEIDEALASPKTEGETVVSLELRKVDALATRGDAAGTHAAIDRIVARARETKDPELAKYAASQLAGVAAKLFAKKRAQPANELLERCREIDPASPVHHPFPAQAEVDFRALPKAAQDWLKELSPGPNSPTIAEPIWTVPVLALLGSAALAFLVWLVLFTSVKPWDAAGTVLAIAFIVGTVMASAWSIRAVLRVLQSPIRAFVTVHPLYVIRARGMRLLVYPLLRLEDVKAVHHHTNGVYTHTQCTLHFGTKAVGVSIRGQDYAQGWLQFVLGRRARALELMAEGYLEAEHGVELIPPALLTEPDVAPLSRLGRAVLPKRADRRGVEPAPWSQKSHPAPVLRKQTLRWYGVAGAVAAALVAFALPYHARLVDEGAYRRALQSQSGTALADYLAAHPDGRYAEAARRMRQQRSAAALAGVDRDATRAPSAAALLAAVEAGSPSHPGETGPAMGGAVVEVPVVIELADEAGLAVRVVTPTPRGMSRARVAERLNDAVRAAGLDEVVRFALSESTTQRPATRLHVRGEARSDGGTFDLWRTARGSSTDGGKGSLGKPRVLGALAGAAPKGSASAAPLALPLERDPGDGNADATKLPSVVIRWEARFVVPGVPESVTRIEVRPPEHLEIPVGDPGAIYARLAQIATDALVVRLASDLGLGAAAVAALTRPAGGSTR